LPDLLALSLVAPRLSHVWHGMLIGGHRESAHNPVCNNLVDCLQYVHVFSCFNKRDALPMQMRQSAAASLKLICRWMELQLARGEKSELAQQLRNMLQEVLLDGGQSSRMPDILREEGQTSSQGALRRGLLTMCLYLTGSSALPFVNSKHILCVSAVRPQTAEGVKTPPPQPSPAPPLHNVICNC